MRYVSAFLFEEQAEEEEEERVRACTYVPADPVSSTCLFFHVSETILIFLSGAVTL